MARIVETSNGRIEGTGHQGARAFLGVPFARPPVGDLRLRPPRPPAPWTGVRPAVDRPPGPPQPRPVPQSEDCLYLSIWTPSLEGSRPVMVWFHGGGLMFGWSADRVYDGTRLALRGDVVVVSVTYRLGALGVLAHPDLRDEDTGVCGNFHLLDQIAALEWVRNDIAAFGGDAANVTIFGESAGAMSAGALLAAPRARGLFARAIVQSGGAAARPLDEQAEIAGRLASHAGVPVAGLREVPVEVVLRAQDEARLQRTTMRGGGFTVDGVVLPQRPLDAIRCGSSAGVGVVSGTTRDEAVLFAGGRAVGEEQLRAYEERVAPGTVDVLRRARMARGEPVTPFDLRFALQTELDFRRPAIELLEAHLEHTPDAWSYLFTWTSKATGTSPHALDVPFTFGNFGEGRMTGPLEPCDRALCDAMQDLWTSFARSGEAWPRYDRQRRATMMLDVENLVVDDPRCEERSVWSGA